MSAYYVSSYSFFRVTNLNLSYQVSFYSQLISINGGLNPPLSGEYPLDGLVPVINPPASAGGN
jgi:hypothetical protein